VGSFSRRCQRLLYEPAARAQLIVLLCTMPSKSPRSKSILGILHNLNIFKRRTSSRQPPPAAAGPSDSGGAIPHTGDDTNASLGPTPTSQIPQSRPPNPGGVLLAPGGRDGEDTSHPQPSSPLPQSGQSNSSTPLPPLDDGMDASQQQASSSTPSSGPSNSGGARRVISERGDDRDGNHNVNQFSTILDVEDDAPQTLAHDVRSIAYEGFKALLVMLDNVGYALPPLKATAAGLSSVMTMIDVCFFRCK
jgi:hypothetical protein